ncbi:MAG: hypothetical protein IT459_06365 [Planctomycetes bacterium]|nr:hypothetical protein [Planctomycetota bacterium]
MQNASCTACATSFNVTGKVPGSVFQCPKCHRGTITVPGAAALEELDASLELAASTPAAGIGSGDELVEEVAEAAPTASASPDPVPTKGPVIRRKTAGSAAAGAARTTSRRGGAPTSTPAAGKKPMLAIAGGVIVLAVAAGVYFTRDGGSKPGPGSTGATGTTGSANAAQGSGTNAADVGANPTASSANDEPIATRLERLAPDDLDTRKALFARAKSGSDAALTNRVARELLLLDANDVEARLALGFRQYEGPARQYTGKWLTDEDHAIAVAAEKLGDFALGKSTSASSARPDAFREAVDSLRSRMQDEFPDSQFEVRFDDGVMPRPYVAAMQKGAGADLDGNEKWFGTALGALYRVYFDRYAERFGLKEVEEPIAIVIFASKAGYDNWQKKNPQYPKSEFIGAYYIPALKRLMLWNTGDASFIGVMFHEGTHQLVHFTCPNGFISPWFQEGFAEFFNGHKIEQRLDPVSGQVIQEYKLGQFLKDRSGSLLTAIQGGSAYSVHDLVHIDYPRFWKAQVDQAEDPAARHMVSMIYAQGWGLIMYLHYAEGGKYKEGFDRYFEAEIAGTADGELFGEIFELETDEDWAAFDEAVREWLKNDLRNV